MEEKVLPQNGTADVEQQQLGAVESPAQPINNKYINLSAINAIIEALKCGERLLVSDIKAKGVIFVRVPGFNRYVNKKHVEDLMVSANNAKGFLHPIHVITAEEYFHSILTVSSYMATRS